MKKFLILLFLFFLLANVIGCGSSSSKYDNKIILGKTAVTINLGETKTTSHSGNLLSKSGTIPASIKSVKFTISATDMVTIERTVSTEVKTAITESFEVLNGANRHFVVEAMNSSGDVLYQGETFANLNGTPVTLTINMLEILTVWAKTYGGGSSDYANSIQQTSDGGFIVAGTTISFGAGSYDFWVLKLDASGNVTWQKTYGGTGTDYAHSIQQTSDSGYIVAGVTTSFGVGSYDFWVMKLNSDGTLAWQKTYGGTGDDVANSIQQTSDGGFIVAGTTISFGAGSYDFWVLKLDASGTVTWQKTYGGGNNDHARSIQQTSDGGYIVAGQTNSFGAGSYDFWVLKLDTSGNITWQKTYGGTASDNASSIQQTSDGGYIVGGHGIPSGSGFGQNWVFKLNSDGTVAWQKTYGDGAGIYSIQQTSDGYIAVGTTALGLSDLDLFVLKLNSSGNVVWQKKYVGTGTENANSVQQTSDGGYIMAGGAGSFGAGSYDSWVLKVDANGEITGCSAMGTSTATASDTSATVSNTGITEANTLVTGSNTSATGTNTIATTTDVCYAAGTTHTLTVNKTGTGSGTVTSSPAGITCGADCNEVYNSGMVVSLTASPDAGFVFSGWSGDPDCSDGQVTMDSDIPLCQRGII